MDQELGKGATSSVYKARDINTGNIFAVKLVYKTRIENEEMLAAVKGEINLMNKCNHQNIVKAYDMFDLPGNYSFNQNFYSKLILFIRSIIYCS